MLFIVLLSGTRDFCHETSHLIRLYNCALLSSTQGGIAKGGRQVRPPPESATDCCKKLYKPLFNCAYAAVTYGSRSCN